MANHYEWFVEGQSKILVESKKVYEGTVDVHEFVQGDKSSSTKMVFGDFGFDYMVEFRYSNYLTNFIGYLDFRVLSAKFNSESINNPTFVVKQLGNDINWSLTPYTKNEDAEYIFDYHRFKQKKPFKDPLAGIDTQDYRKKVLKKSTQDVRQIEAEISPDIKQILDFLYEMEHNENEIKDENFNFTNRKNSSFFFLSVPNETLCVEVYQDKSVVGYAFFPMANMSFGQIYFEEIISLLPDAINPVLGDLLVRMNFYPISMKTDLTMVGSLGSLDFDDISKRYQTASGLFEACILMDQNIKDSKKLIWPDKIENVFKNTRKTRRLILNITDFQNLANIYSPQLDFNSFVIKGKITLINLRDSGISLDKLTIFDF